METQANEANTPAEAGPSPRSRRTKARAKTCYWRRRMGPDSSADVPLNCLAGRMAPPGLGEDLGCMRRWPRGGAPEDLASPRAEPRREALAGDRASSSTCSPAAYAIEDLDLARAVKACRFLLREAARVDLSASALSADLERLCPDAPVIQGDPPRRLRAGEDAASSRDRARGARRSRQRARRGQVASRRRWRPPSKATSSTCRWRC